MKMKTVLLALLCVGLVGSLSNEGVAASIALFQTDALGASETSSPVTSADANVAVGDLTEGPGLANYGWTTSLAVRNHDLTADLASAVVADDYLSFTVTPSAGYAVDYEDLNLFIDLNGAAGNSASSTDLSLTSNVDGYASALGTVTANHTAGLGGTEHNTLTMNLGTSLQGITAPIEFRLYLHSPTGLPNGLGIGWIFNGSAVADDLHLLGTVTQVPEPSTLGLILLSSVAMVLRRRA